MSDEQTMQILYFQVTDIWKELCEAHNDLLEKTFDEYSLLLASDVEGLEDKIREKQETIKQIDILDRLRGELIIKLTKDTDAEISSVSDLLIFMNKFEEERERKHLRRFNALLIDIIEKIQTQNKKNQLFINKAIHSLQEIREGALGKKSYSTYNVKGNTTHSISRA